MCERDVVNVVRYLDKNGDGKVDWDEFSFFMEESLSLCKKKKFGTALTIDKAAR